MKTTEKKIEHSAGPWKVMFGNDENLSIKEIYSVAGRTHLNIGRVCFSFALSDDEREANARLIAAAPELLEALEKLLKGRRKGDKERFYWLEVDIEDDYAAEDAIKKARGQ